MHAAEAGAPAIDAVIAWVDGADPAHAARLAEHLAELGHRPETAAPTRFHSLGEIDYCITSLLRFAPFLRRIHIVTDRQVPPIWTRSRDWPAFWRDKLALVDHRQIFQGFEACLPTFNCRPIETLLYRIPDLAEHFVYLNDDFMLIKPVAPQAWFHEDRPVLRGRWRRPVDNELSQRLRQALRRWAGRAKPLRPLHQRSQALAAGLLGYDRRYYATHHVPNPMRRSTLARYFEAHPQVLAGNLAHRLRDLAQFNTPALANHLEIQAGSACLQATEQRLYAEPGALSAPMLAKLLLQAGQDPALLFACFQSLDEASPAAQATLLGWLDRTIGREPPGCGDADWRPQL